MFALGLVRLRVRVRTVTVTLTVTLSLTLTLTLTLTSAASPNHAGRVGCAASTMRTEQSERPTQCTGRSPGSGSVTSARALVPGAHGSTAASCESSTRSGPCTATLAAEGRARAGGAAAGEGASWRESHAAACVEAQQARSSWLGLGWGLGLG